MTNRKLTTISSQNTGLEIKKTQALFKLTDRALAMKSRYLMSPEDDSWIYALWAWADENELSEEIVPRNRISLRNLKELSLGSKGLTNLPPEIGHLQNLNELNLSRNKLISLPPEIGRLNTLTTLNLYLNDLTELPQEIGQLRNLTSLDIGWNEISWQEIEKFKTLLPNCTVRL